MPLRAKLLPQQPQTRGLVRLLAFDSHYFEALVLQLEDIKEECWYGRKW